MRARHEITRKIAKQHQAAPKKDRGQLLDEVCAITGCSRVNARRQLEIALKPRPIGTKKWKPSPRKYSHDAVKVLQLLRVFAGGISGKYFISRL